MKTIKHISLWVVVATCMVAVSTRGNAQAVSSTYFNVDWQFNAPVGNSYADKASGWGIDRQTLMLKSNSALTTDQQHSLFQLPFGLLAKYRFTTDGILEPYATVKLGANYSRMSSYLQAWEIYDDTWGFTVSPEIGVSIFPNPSVRYGFHVALYYNYATNKSKVLTYDIDGRNNIGFRLGVSF